MSEALEAGAETPAAAPEPAEIPATEAPEAAEAPEGAAEAEEAAGEPSEAREAAPEPERKPKNPISALQGRVGHLTKTIHQKDADLAERDRQIAAYRALLEAQGKLSDGEGAPAAPRAASQPAPGTPEFEKLVQTEAQKVAAQREFDAQCNAILDTGKEKYGTAFEEGVTTLNALGILNVPMVQAAMATGAAPDVINALGADAEEASRIAALPPHAMGVELAKLALKLSAPKDPKQVSRAPAPIKPVGGAAQADLDIYDDKLSDDEYYRRRAAQGARYIRAK